MTAYHPLSLSAPNVRAALSGEQFTISRKVAPQPGPEYDLMFIIKISAIKRHIGQALFNNCGSWFYARSPWGSPGQRFWVREAWGQYYVSSNKLVGVCKEQHPDEDLDWQPARTMPREYSRINVVLLSVTVEQIAGVWRWIGTVGREA